MATRTETVPIEVKFTGAAEFAQEVGRALGKNKIKTDVKGLHDEVAKAGKKWKTIAAQAMEDSFGAKSARRIKDLGKEFETISSKIAKSQDRLAMSSLGKQEKESIRLQLKSDKVAMSSLEDRLKVEADQRKKWASRRESVSGFAKEQFKKGGVNRLESGISRLTEAIRRPDLKKGGQKISGLGEKVFGAGMKRGGGMGGALKALGGMAIVLGGLVAMVGLLVKMFSGVRKEIRLANKEMVKAGGAANLMFKGGFEGASELTKRLKTLREASIDVSNNLKWMTTSKEQMEILTAFSAAGQGLKVIAGNAKDAREEMEKYQEATAFALTYAKLLGMEAPAVAKDIAEVMSDTGRSLSEVRDGFSQMVRLTRDSGFNMKRFYAIVIEASSGLGFYNVRLEESAKLLKNFTSILGKKPGVEMFKAVQGSFEDLDYRSRVKKLMSSGKTNVAEITGEMVKNAVRDFSKTLRENKQVELALSNISGEFGIDMTKSAGDIAKKIASLTDDQFDSFLSKFRRELGPSATTGALAQQLSIMKQRQGAVREGPGQLGRQASALGTAVGGEALAFKMATFLLRPIHKQGIKNVIAFQELNGITGKQFEQLKALSQAFTGDFKNLIAMTKRGDKSSDEWAAENLAWAKQLGFAVDKDGRIRAAQWNDMMQRLDFSGEGIKTMNGYLSNQGTVVEETLAQNDKAYTYDQYLAREVIANTESIAKALDIVVAGWLEKIHAATKPLQAILIDVLKAVAVWLHPSVRKALDTQELEASKSRLMGSTRSSMRSTMGQLSVTKGQRRDLIGELNQAKDPSERRAIQTQIADRESAISYQSKVVAHFRSMMGALSGMDASKTADYFNEKTSEFVANMSPEQREEYLKITATIEKVEKEKKAQLDKDKKERKQFELNQQSKTLAKDIGLQMSFFNRKERTLDLLSGLDVKEKKINKILKDMDQGLNREGQVQRLINDKFQSLLPEARGGISSQITDLGLQIPKPVDDFIITSSGQVLKPSANDTIIGAKPGGPLSRSGGMTFNIYESHNPEKTYQTVKRVLRDARLI